MIVFFFQNRCVWLERTSSKQNNTSFDLLKIFSRFEDLKKAEQGDAGAHVQFRKHVGTVEVCGKKKACFYASTLVNGYLYHCGQIYLPEEFCVSCGCCMRTINRRQRTCTRVVPTRMQEKYN